MVAILAVPAILSNGLNHLRLCEMDLLEADDSFHCGKTGDAVFSKVEDPFNKSKTVIAINDAQNGEAVPAKVY